MISNTVSVEKKRDTNIELLRILAMVLIVLNHYLNFGGALFDTQAYSSTYVISWSIHAFRIAVNCYVLISGYFLVNSVFKIKKLLILWGQVIFYSITISLILWLTGTVEFSLKDLVYTVLPVLTKKYWFATTYIGLYLLSPFLNIAINAMTKKQMKSCIVMMLIIFSLWNTIIPFAKTLDNSDGAGIIWFVCLYIIAAYVRLHYNPNYKNKRYLIICVVTTIVIALSKFVAIFITNKLGISSGYSNILYHHNSLTILLSSVAFFLFIINIKIKRKDTRSNNFILRISSATFGVYLIHEHFLLRNILWEGIVKSSKYYDTPLFITYTLLVVASVYIACTIIEMIRKVLFNKIENGKCINKITNKLSKYFVKG